VRRAFGDLLGRLRQSIPYQRVPFWKGQLIAVLCVLAGAIIRWPLDPILIDAVPFITFFPAVLVSSVWGGTRSGLTALVLTIIVAGVGWIDPDGGLGLTILSGASVAAFAVFGGSVVLVAELLRSALKDLAKSEERANLLAAEMKHRVKNAFAIASAVSRQTSRNVDSVAEYRAALESRLNALAQAQELASKEAMDATDLSEVVGQICAPFDLSRFGIAGPPFQLAHDLVPMMALLIHELATNAAKYGALSAPAGRVRIEWVRASSTLLVDWQEMDGPPVSAPSRSGFGARLIQSAFAPERAKVTLEYCPDGLRCRISIETPPTAVAEATDSFVETGLSPAAPVSKQLT
jgi:two-component sensor histidine kinase